jgi:hypothetical protein
MTKPLAPRLISQRIEAVLDVAQKMQGDYTMNAIMGALIAMIAKSRGDEALIQSMVAEKLSKRGISDKPIQDRATWNQVFTDPVKLTLHLGFRILTDIVSTEEPSAEQLKRELDALLEQQTSVLKDNAPSVAAMFTEMHKAFVEYMVQPKTPAHTKRLEETKLTTGTLSAGPC